MVTLLISPGLKIALLAMMVLALLFLAVFLAARISWKKINAQEEGSEDHSMIGLNVDVMIGSYDERCGAYSGTFFLNGQDHAAYVRAEKGVFPATSCIRAQILEQGDDGTIYLVPLEWPENLPKDVAFVTYCDRLGRWHCAYRGDHGYQMAGMVKGDAKTLLVGLEPGTVFTFPSIDVQSREVYLGSIVSSEDGGEEDLPRILGQQVEFTVAKKCDNNYPGLMGSFLCMGVTYDCGVLCMGPDDLDLFKEGDILIGRVVKTGDTIYLEPEKFPETEEIHEGDGKCMVWDYFPNFDDVIEFRGVVPKRGCQVLINIGEREGVEVGEIVPIEPEPEINEAKTE